MHHFITLMQVAVPTVTTSPGVTEPTVTISFQPSQVLTWLLVGLIAGALASIFAGERISMIGSLVVGLLGALIGGFLFTLLRIQPSAALEAGITIRWIDIIVAFVGALIVLIIFGGVFRRRRL